MPDKGRYQPLSDVGWGQFLVVHYRAIVNHWIDGGFAGGLRVRLRF